MGQTLQARQVQDRAESLQLMLEDMNRASELYRPTNYWSVYEKRFLPELRSQGLKDFRRRRNSVLSSFGATDYRPVSTNLFQYRLLNNRLSRSIPGWRTSLRLANLALGYLDPALKPGRLAATMTQAAAGTRARPFGSFEVSTIGAPEHSFLIKQQRYTMDAVYRYLCYAYCSEFVDFDTLHTVVELGSGAGKQVEVLKKLHPHLSFLVFDIPPQLYVCQQYLSAVFPGDVVPYEATRNRRSLALEPGKILICGTWQFPLLATMQVDLFWNCCSFQEMEPPVVENYLGVVNGSAARVYLAERMQGKQVAANPGDPGVLQATVLEHYRHGLPDFTLVDQRPHPMATSDKESQSWWVRR